MLRSVCFCALLLALGCKKKIETQTAEALLETNVELHTIDARNLDTIVAAGGSRYDHGQIFTTHNGGQTWHEQQPASDKAFYSIRFVTPQRVIAGGYFGRYFQSPDAGLFWEDAQLSVWRTIRDIAGHGNYVWLAGGDGLRTGFVTHDNAQGTPYNIIPDTFQNEFRSLLHTTDFIYAAGYGLVLRSSDLGNTWQPTSAEGDFFIGMAFVNGTLYVAGMNGKVLASKNHGDDWTHLKRGNSPTQLNTLYNAFGGNENGLVLAGENGKIMWFDIAQEKWYKLDAGTDDDITGLKMLDDVFVCSTRQGRVLKITLP